MFTLQAFAEFKAGLYTSGIIFSLAAAIIINIKESGDAVNFQIISEHLIKLRQKQAWTQEDLARKLVISRQAVSKWETGVSLPDPETLLKLSHLYHVSINEILEPDEYHKLKTIEEIVEIDKECLRSILGSADRQKIVKASLGTSPAVSAYLQQVFSDIDFQHERLQTGSVRIEEIESIHAHLLNIINRSNR